MAGIVLDNVSKFFPGPVRAVSRLNLEVLDHELMVLVGPSGCGKSTILRLIAGLERPSEGEVRIGGIRANEMSPRQRNIAMTFQNGALHPQLSVRRNMTFGLELRSSRRLWFGPRRPLIDHQIEPTALNQADLTDRVEQIATHLGIDELLERMPATLSGGERQRVALGRALVRRPAAYLFDEPLSNLDAHLRGRVRQTLKLHHQQFGTTAVHVTHDQVEALSLGDRVAVMNQAGLQQVGSPQEVYDRPKNQFVAGFIGTPPMNFLRGELLQSGQQIVFRRGNRSLALSTQAGARVQQCIGRSVTMGVRPENLTLVGAPARDQMFCARVSLVEPLGDASIVTLVVGDMAIGENAQPWELTAKVAAGYPARMGEDVGVMLDWQRVQWFDASTDENLKVSWY